MGFVIRILIISVVVLISVLLLGNVVGDSIDDGKNVFTKTISRVSNTWDTFTNNLFPGSDIVDKSEKGKIYAKEVWSAQTYWREELCLECEDTGSCEQLEDTCGFDNELCKIKIDDTFSTVTGIVKIKNYKKYEDLLSRNKICPSIIAGVLSKETNFGNMMGEGKGIASCESGREEDNLDNETQIKCLRNYLLSAISDPNPEDETIYTEGEDRSPNINYNYLPFGEKEAEKKFEECRELAKNSVGVRYISKGDLTSINETAWKCAFCHYKVGDACNEIYGQR